MVEHVPNARLQEVEDSREADKIVSIVHEKFPHRGEPQAEEKEVYKYSCVVAMYS